MSFDQSTITAGPLFSRRGADLYVSWESSSPDGTWFHLYAAGRLAWAGTRRAITLPWPNAATVYRVGAVDPAEASVDLSSTLPSLPGSGGAARARLTWNGGQYLDPDGRNDVAGFNVYGEDTPGGGIDYGTVLGTVLVASGRVLLDGAGMGGAGEGGAGSAAGAYEWTSGPLSAGTWNFGVKPFDRAGNEGTAETVAYVVAAPPRPPGANSVGVRLTYSYNAGSGVATLNWSASPA